MPLLPSGKKLYISNESILEPNPGFFRCPDGHFWYRTPDLAINKPPFEPGMTIITDFVHAPVPKNREEVKKYILVLIGLEGDDLYWRGDLLSEYPPPGELDEADRAVWDEWVESESNQRFLDLSIERCREQANANRSNTGWVSVHVDEKQGATPPETIRLNEIERRVRELENLSISTRAARDERASYEIYIELEALLDETSTVRRGLVGDAGYGAFVEGYLNRVLVRWKSAEACFRESLRAAPFSSHAWLELTWCLCEQHDYLEGEVAARRAVEIAPKLPQSWGNLAMVLIQLGKREEARRSLDRALELDPDNEKNLHNDKHFDAFFEGHDKSAELMEVN